MPSLETQVLRHSCDVSSDKGRKNHDMSDEAVDVFGVFIK